MMRIALRAGLATAVLALAGCESVSPETWSQLGTVIGGAGLSTDTVVAGLKEALSVGAERAAGDVARPGGYSTNPALKLLLPEKIEKVTGALRKIGFGSYVDEFEGKMNEAAEQAAAKAVPVFVDAVKGMSFEDAKGILQGADNAATEYFRSKTSAGLRETYAPIVRKTMADVGAAQIYNSLIDKYNAIPLTTKPDFSLDAYVTEKALDGLFLKLSEMEKDIRTNPAARTTALLKRVFGKR